MLIRFRWVGLLLFGTLTVAAQKTDQPNTASTLAFAPISWPAPVVLSAPDLAALRREDAEQTVRGRFAAPVPADIRSSVQGEWQVLPDSSAVWRCRIQAPGALGMILLFEQLILPEGGTIEVYDVQRRKIRGPFDRTQQTPTQRFTIGPLPGDDLIVEYHAPPYTRGSETIFINRIDYAYQQELNQLGEVASVTDFDDALSCNVNIQCPEGVNWQTEKKGIARILMVFNNGSAWCSGSLIANTGNTGTPYFLTAHHCQILLTTPKFDQWTFDFHYEYPACTSTGTEPTGYKTVVGCERMSWRAETDMLLLKLNPIPPSFDVYFNGWTRATGITGANAFIHHPRGDVKKFSSDISAPVIHNAAINWGGVFGTSAANTHWKVVPEVGIFEPGSSGSPLFTSDKRIIGQMHGGIANNCNITAVYFGMFNLSWDQGSTATSRLKDWLDPANTNPMVQNGYIPPVQPLSISGNIKTWAGANLPDVRIAVSGGIVDTVTTDTAGNFMVSNLAPGLNYVLTPITKPNPLNGVSAFDLVLTSRHILNLEPLTPAWKIIAADVNESGTVTSFDIVEARKVLIGSLPNFNSQRPWRFFPANTSFADPLNPFPSLPASTLTFQGVLQSVSGANFFGVKIGDLDHTVVPQGN